MTFKQYIVENKDVEIFKCVSISLDRINRISEQNSSSLKMCAYVIMQIIVQRDPENEFARDSVIQDIAREHLSGVLYNKQRTVALLPVSYRNNTKYFLISSKHPIFDITNNIKGSSVLCNRLYNCTNAREISDILDTVADYSHTNDLFDGDFLSEMI